MNLHLTDTKTSSLISILAIIISFFGGVPGMVESFKPKTIPRIQFIDMQAGEAYLHDLNHRISYCIVLFTLSNTGKNDLSKRGDPKLEIESKNKWIGINIELLNDSIYSNLDDLLKRWIDANSVLDFSIANPKIKPGTSRQFLLFGTSQNIKYSELLRANHYRLVFTDSFGKSHSVNLEVDLTGIVEKKSTFIYERQNN